MSNWFIRLFEPSPASLLREATVKAQLEKANADWIQYNCADNFSRELQSAVSTGRFGITLKWGEEFYFVKGSHGREWIDKRGITLTKPGWAMFWSLRW